MNFRHYVVIILSGLFFNIANATPANDPLPSWNNSNIKSSIITFVQNTINPQSPMYVAPEDRIATFDNDGTLWVEQPMYTQMIFAIDRVKALAPQHPEWANEEPFKSILANDLSKLTPQDIARVIEVTHSGMSVQDFDALIKQWLATAKDKRFNRYYTELVYQPMLEVINYLRVNHFKIYIVSGGGQEFIRAYAEKTYGISSDQVIGTASKTKYVYRDNQPVLIKTPGVLFVDDKDGKPEAINLFIGKKPIIAFGNSDGDEQMLEWTQSGGKNNLMFLVHHDDAKREYAYDNHSKIGTFSDYLLQDAKEKHWFVISMKDDWKVMFPWQIAPQTQLIPQQKPLPTVQQIIQTQPVKKALRKKQQHAERTYHSNTQPDIITY